VLCDPTLVWVPEKTPLQSKSKNTPFYRRSIEGRVLMTLVDGKVVFETGAEIGAGTSPRSAR
jgi:dihydroorotase